MPGHDVPFLTFDERPSDSPVIERVWRSASVHGGLMHSVAACHWEMVVVRYQGQVTLRVRGPETRASVVPVPADAAWFAIRFKLGTFMPMFRPGALRDLNDVVLPDAAARKFWLHGSAWDYPDFDDAETFAKRLVRSGLVVIDPVVRDALRADAPPSTSRLEQRHILRVTGLTRTAIRQIERARRATRLLRAGSALTAAAYDAGYFDQAHMTRSLKRWVGLTPAQVASGRDQLSLLYNTGDD